VLNMLIPPGVEVLVNDCLGTDQDSPSVQLKELLTLMSANGVTVASILPLSPEHLIVIGYMEPDSGNAKAPPGTGPGGARKR
jgi:hypothetical protein